MAGVGIAGLAGAILFSVLILTGKTRSAIQAGSGNAAIYAETFAVWMLLFIALTLVASLLVRSQPDSQLLVSSAASVLSLGALIWPAVRGVRWSQVRRDIGLFPGKRPIVEIFWGVVCYVSNVPVLVIGVLATWALLSLYSAAAGTAAGMDPTQTPAHPIIDWISDAAWSERVYIFVLACLIAPAVEETVFRGVLYRHLREGTAKWRTGASVAFSTALNSLIFAVIHPQGLLAAPALMAVATGLSLAREWRGSLLAPTTMHATNNGLMMLLLFWLI
jgi:membrane protease YdiL (CAAX protease family)